MQASDRRLPSLKPAPWALAALSGLLCSLSFARWEGVYLEPLAWVGLVPLLIALERNQRPWWCCAAYAIAFQWANLWALIDLLGPGVGLLLLNAAGAWLLPAAYVLLRRRYPMGMAIAIWVPASVVLEWAQAHWLATNAPWWLLGASQARLVPVIQMAHITGTAGLTAWVLAINGLLAAATRRHQWRPTVLSIALLVVAAPWIYGSWRLAWAETHAQGGHSAPSLRIAAIGTGVPTGDADRMALAMQASERAVREGADLLAWPEGVNVPGLPHTPASKEALLGEVRAWNTPLVLAGTRFRAFSEAHPPTDFERRIGAHYAAETGSAVLTPWPYDHPAAVATLFEPKRRLVPFQEFIPGAAALPALAAWLHPYAQHGRAHWFTPGTQFPRPMPIPFAGATAAPAEGGSVPLAVVLCFELLYAQDVALRVQQGAQAIVWQTNDEDAIGSHYGYQFAQFARLRAVETGRDVVRINTDGQHFHLDASGRMVASSRASQRPSYAVFQATLRQNATWASQHPWSFVAACTLAVFALLTAQWARARSASGRVM
ncbi:hypothetical protein [Acidovorax lacteus]|uniref:Apolipoprotein N-acyltransferase n=1 Tax=Acidovorax lacteus TaxID=1924988 RepID=A0ABP8L7V8_9BURK